MSLSSCLGFMLPLACLNNFMALGVGELKMKDMIKCGIYVNCICTLMIFFYTNSFFEVIFSTTFELNFNSSNTDYLNISVKY